MKEHVDPGFRGRERECRGCWKGQNGGLRLLLCILLG